MSASGILTWSDRPKACSGTQVSAMSDESYVNKEKVTILAGDPVRDFWLTGAVNRYPEYTFRAKVFDVGSVFGIGQGRISKLQVRRGDRVVMNYDRGWDQPPEGRRDRKALQEIVAGFPDRPRDQESAQPLPMEQKARRISRVSESNRERSGDDYER
jgi:hypothetical protein